jgi:acyl-homoserine-lactone acylase
MRLHRLTACFLTAAAAIPSTLIATPGPEVKIIRTEYGIPHITAPDMYGAGYGSGYAYAQDNACTFLEEVVTIRGERSLYFGADTLATDVFVAQPDAFTNILSDTYYRHFFDDKAFAFQKAGLGKDAGALVGGYVAGFNTFVSGAKPTDLAADCRGKPWVRPITERDVTLRGLQFNLRGGLNGMAQDFGRAVPPEDDAPASKPVASIKLQNPTASGLGSNMAAYGRNRTENGRGLQFANPHFPWSGIERLYVQHLTVPGLLDIFGPVLHGMPFNGIGFNGSQANSLTWSSDKRLLIRELSLDPKDPTAYIVDGRSEKMKRNVVRVPVAVATNAAGFVEHTVYETRYGAVLGSPLLPWTKTKAYVAWDVNSENARLYPQLLGLMQAKSVAEVQQSLTDIMGLPFSNVISADKDGNTLFANYSVAPNISDEQRVSCLKTPEAQPFLDEFGIVVLDGSRSACAPQSSKAPQAAIVPANRKPLLITPEYVVQSNDSHWIVNADERNFQKGFPKVIGGENINIGERTRLAMRFAEDRRLSRDGLPGNKMTADAYATLFWRGDVLLANFIIPSLVESCERDPIVSLEDGTKIDLAKACLALKKWDRSVRPDSRGGHIFGLFTEELNSVPGNAQLALSDDNWKVKFDPNDPVNTPRDFIVTEAARQVLGSVVAKLNAANIPLDAPLSQVQFVERNGVRIPIGGGPESYNNFKATVVAGKGITDPVPFADSYIHIVEFGDTGPLARGVMSYSQSTNPESPYYDDMTKVYSERHFFTLPFSKQEIEAHKIEGGVTLKYQIKNKK